MLMLFACSDAHRTGDIRQDGDGDPSVAGKAVGSVASASTEEATWPKRFGFGKHATESDIARWDIDIRPDGKGLPNGTGSAKAGRTIYLAKCAACHGLNGDEGPYDVLISSEQKSIGTYWPYATTLFDYIRRTMPFNMPGTLTDEEVYQLTAYLLSANGIIDSNEVMDAKRLPQVEMPARASFIPDDRKGGPEIK
ncbi:c-type cytochrome [Parapedobacter sp. 2B3]